MIVGAIPARYASTRFPGKLLADLHGRSVLERTWRRASRSASLDRLVIAAGDEVIASAARGFGAEVIELFQDFNSG
ncbi:MAG TPA: 3-deoxy-manno-octulosonate cytidylyltransferase, partial [Bacteroidetes bacterium]|nr:3-deoxy-manno-octulosonate cytidylyltransferase [Bacteroidota bacterium]